MRRSINSALAELCPSERCEAPSSALAASGRLALPCIDMESRKAQYYTARQLSELGEKNIPALYSVTSHLVYSSPATLAYNSPGAEGFGVKRAGLAIPDSVMLIISPPCCGRNTSQISEIPQYRNRFFYLEMDETDLVTGRHLKRIPDAVSAIVDTLGRKPSLVMLCATCVDALLGTDWDRVARSAEEKSGVRVRPCYMYALTREGHRPPMIHVRQSLYSLLEKTKRERGEVNLLGFFASLRDEAELYRYLDLAGVKAVRELSRAGSYEAFQEMARAQFNLVLNPESRAAADDLSARLGMPYIELKRFYDPDRIHRQYSAFFGVLGIPEEGVQDESMQGESVHEISIQKASVQEGNAQELNAQEESVPEETDAGTRREKREERETLRRVEKYDYEETARTVQDFFIRHPHLKIAVGETLNADPFELALSFAAAGAEVREVFGTVTAEAMPYIQRLAEFSPETRFYCNQDPSMMFYRDGENKIDIAVGKDAAHYHPETPGVSWNEDRQPFGYAGVRSLYAAMEEALAGEEAADRKPAGSDTAGAAARKRWNSITPSAVREALDSAAGGAGIVSVCGGGSSEAKCGSESSEPAGGGSGRTGSALRAFRARLTPFAPDQSGAVSVLYALGGMTVIVDAGGCTGNICGFDEPRWLMPQNLAGGRDDARVAGGRDVAFRQQETETAYTETGYTGAVFSAGLRDMDAILGRDDLLVSKLEEAAKTIAPSFIALVGTPVPAVIGTDYQALKRMAEKKTSLKVLPVASNGMELYDRGIEAALLELVKTFAGEGHENTKEDRQLPTIGVLGFTPMDFQIPEDAEALKRVLKDQGYGEVLLYGLEGGLDAVKRAGTVSRNLVVSPAGIAAAKYLEKTFGIPYETGYPAETAESRELRDVPGGPDRPESRALREVPGNPDRPERPERPERPAGKDIGTQVPTVRSDKQPEASEDPGTAEAHSARILIVHQQVRANALREEIRKMHEPAITAASWFMMVPELEETGDVRLGGEEDFVSLVSNGGYDLIVADPVMKRLVPFYKGVWVDAVHFAVSGQIPGGDRG